MLYNLHMINHQSHLDPRTLHSPAIPLSESPVPTQHTSAKGIIQLFVQIRQEHKITRYLDDVNNYLLCAKCENVLSLDIQMSAVWLSEKAY